MVIGVVNDISIINIGIGLYVYTEQFSTGKGRPDVFLAKIYFVGVIRRFETETVNLAIST
jgi:hypothetical protein